MCETNLMKLGRVLSRKEDQMATVTDIKTKGYCDVVYDELENMQMRIREMSAELTRVYGKDTNIAATFERHLADIAEQIEWKLQILSHACPFDWKGSRGYMENAVSVSPPEPGGMEFSGGYVGG